MLLIICIAKLMYLKASLPIGLILYPCLTILLAILSKIIFKESFSAPQWLGSFIIVMVLSAAAVLMYLVTEDIIVPSVFLEADEAMGFAFLAVIFSGFSFAYFIAYLINFIVRLVRRGKRKKEINGVSE